jgi:hypothetical protein
MLTFYTSSDTEYNQVKVWLNRLGILTSKEVKILSLELETPRY